MYFLASVYHQPRGFAFYRVHSIHCFKRNIIPSIGRAPHQNKQATNRYAATPTSNYFDIMASISAWNTGAKMAFTVAIGNPKKICSHQFH